LAKTKAIKCKIRDNKNFRQILPKDLRHFFASIILNRSSKPMEIANQMGHSNVELQIERYGKYLVPKLHEALKFLDREDEGVQMVCTQK
jgi:integrase